MQGGVGVERRALVSEHRVRRPAQPLAQGADEARLADAGLAAEQHQLPLAVSRPPPAVEQQGQLRRAPDQRCQARGRFPRLEAARRPARPQHAPGRHRRGETLELARAELGEVEQAGDEPPRAGADHHGPGLGQRLQPGREVGRLADRVALARPTLTAAGVANHHRAGGDADPGPERGAARRREPGDRPDELEPGADRALGVVLVRLRVAEVGEDAIAEELGEMAAVAGDHHRAGVVVAPDQLPEVLWVEPRREGG